MRAAPPGAARERSQSADGSEVIPVRSTNPRQRLRPAPSCISRGGAEDPQPRMPDALRAPAQRCAPQQRPSGIGAAQGRPVRHRGEPPGADAASQGRGPKRSSGSAAGLFPPRGAAEEPRLPRDGSWRGVCTRQMETGAVYSHRSSLAPAALVGVLSKFRWRLKFLTRGFKRFLSPAKRGLNALQLFPGARWGTHVRAPGARAAGRRAARESTGCATASAPPRPRLQEHGGGTAATSRSTESSKTTPGTGAELRHRASGAAPTVRGFCSPTRSHSPPLERPRALLELQRYTDGTPWNAAPSLLQTKITKNAFPSHPYRTTPLSEVKSKVLFT